MIRCLSHGDTRRACLNAANVAFPPEIHEFALVFVQLHDARMAADYNPMVVVHEDEVLSYVSQAEKVIAGLDSVSLLDQKAFATWIMVQTQGAKDSRKRLREGRETEL